MKKVRISLGAPALIAQAPPEVRHWGPYQFPEVERLADGRLHCRYHVELDSATAYGKDGGHAVSSDNGATWREEKPFMGVGGVLLPNGDRVRLRGMKALSLSPEELPRETLGEALCNSSRIPLYSPDDFSYEQSGIHFERLPADADSWETCRTDVRIPYMTRHLQENLLPYPGFSRLRVAPDGTLWGILYSYTYRDHVAGFAAIFLTSRDSGTTWRYRSSIYYEPDKTDRFWAIRTGYTEPNLAFLPDGSLLCLLRTDDSFNRGPSYAAYSTDGGFHWTRPAQFDDRGVWPALLTLENGVTLAAYGRPGLFLRATADPSGRVWEERIPIVQPAEWEERTIQAERFQDPDLPAGQMPLSDDDGNTCAYSSLMPLSANSAYLVYSKFDHPNAQGIPAKAILGRVIRAEIQ